jgi:hypothetical protein
MQECMAVDADELRRDIRRLEAFHSSLNQLARGVEASGTKVQQSLQVRVLSISGFYRRLVFELVCEEGSGIHLEIHQARKTSAEKLGHSCGWENRLLQAGFDSMQAVLVERAGALLAQAADVTAERLAMVRAQGDRTMVCVKEAKAVVAIAERVGLACSSPRLRDTAAGIGRRVACFGHFQAESRLVPMDFKTIREVLGSRTPSPHH